VLDKNISEEDKLFFKEETIRLCVERQKMSLLPFSSKFRLAMLYSGICFEIGASDKYKALIKQPRICIGIAPQGIRWFSKEKPDKDLIKEKVHIVYFDITPDFRLHLMFTYRFQKYISHPIFQKERAFIRMLKEAKNSEDVRSLIKIKDMYSAQIGYSQRELLRWNEVSAEVSNPDFYLTKMIYKERREEDTFYFFRSWNKYLMHWFAGMRELAIEAVTNLRKEDAIPILEKMAQNDDKPYIRELAKEAVKKLRR
jgi:hypothetical protein